MQILDDTEARQGFGFQVSWDDWPCVFRFPLSPPAAGVSSQVLSPDPICFAWKITEVDEHKVPSETPDVVFLDGSRLSGCLDLAKLQIIPAILDLEAMQLQTTIQRHSNPYLKVRSLGTKSTSFSPSPPTSSTSG